MQSLDLKTFVQLRSSNKTTFDDTTTNSCFCVAHRAVSLTSSTQYVVLSNRITAYCISQNQPVDGSYGLDKVQCPLFISQQLIFVCVLTCTKRWDVDEDFFFLQIWLPYSILVLLLWMCVFLLFQKLFLRFYGRIYPILISPEQDFCMCTYLHKEMGC